MWSKYEAKKRRLQTMNLPPAEYERRIQEIIKTLERASERREICLKQKEF